MEERVYFTHSYTCNFIIKVVRAGADAEAVQGCCIGLLSMTFSDSFMELRATSSGVAPPKMGWTFPGSITD